MKPASQKEIGAQLQRLRRRAGLTQEQAARRAGISNLTLGRIERGQQWSDFRVFQKLAQTYEVSFSELFAVPPQGRANEDQDALLDFIMAKLRTRSVADLLRVGELLEALFKPLPKQPASAKKPKKKKNINA